ncbi:MAG TPA: toxin-antitoxin system HicB family antitoxin [Bacteroidetes bacterium]|nr:toxin-antitoxin system HicB family antitoxin [Bacteroidota bacterium]HRK05900.1 type II toxin-antitoxin system HicB family antitoxin [Chlorobiota bacterium]
MNLMTFESYSARIEYDNRDNIFVGHVVGLTTQISFHGASISALQRAFAAAIRDYLSDCRARGVEPERPMSGKMLLRLNPDVHAAAARKAARSGVSINQWVADVVRAAVEP